MKSLKKPLTILGWTAAIGLLAALSVSATVRCGNRCCGGGSQDKSCPVATNNTLAASGQDQTCPVPSKDTTPASGEQIHPQTTCPVMGGPINKKFFADYQGKRVYFCCSGCIAAFQKEPAKYVKQLEDAGVTLEKSPASASQPEQGPAK